MALAPDTVIAFSESQFIAWFNQSVRMPQTASGVAGDTGELGACLSAAIAMTNPHDAKSPWRQWWCALCRAPEIPLSNPGLFVAAGALEIAIKRSLNKDRLFGVNYNTVTNMLRSMRMLGLEAPASTYEDRDYVDDYFDGFHSAQADNAAIAGGWPGVLSFSVMLLTTFEMSATWHQRSISVPKNTTAINAPYNDAWELLFPLRADAAGGDDAPLLIRFECLHRDTDEVFYTCQEPGKSQRERFSQAALEDLLTRFADPAAMFLHVCQHGGFKRVPNWLLCPPRSAEAAVAREDAAMEAIRSAAHLAGDDWDKDFSGWPFERDFYRHKAAAVGLAAKIYLARVRHSLAHDAAYRAEYNGVVLHKAHQCLHEQYGVQ
jgi:hypothetical protein